MPADTPMVPTAPVPSEGSVRLRVRYCECDPMKVVHHAAYIPWLEIARTEILRGCGVSYAQMEESGAFLVIVKLEAKYRKPVLYDDIVEVRVRVSGGGRVKIEHEYEVVVVERGGKPADLSACVASTTLACVDGEGKLRELPDWLIAR
jgi:acyl-CoA thioester hydrolase